MRGRLPCMVLLRIGAPILSHLRCGSSSGACVRQAECFMAEPATQSVEDLIAQILRDHYLRRRMRWIAVVGSLLFYLIVDIFDEVVFRARPPLFHFAIDGLFALSLGTSVMVAF